MKQTVALCSKQERERDLYHILYESDWAGRPVLIGTASIAQSEELSRLLSRWCAKAASLLPISTIHLAPIYPSPQCRAAGVVMCLPTSPENT